MDAQTLPILIVFAVLAVLQLAMLYAVFAEQRKANATLAEIKAALTPSGPAARATPDDDDLRTIRHFEQLYDGEPSYAPIDYSQQTGERTVWR